MAQVYVKIKGITCDNCRNKITKELLKIKQIKEVSLPKDVATINYTGELNKTKIITTINNLDYFTKEEYINSNKDDLTKPVTIKEFLLIFITIILVIYALNKIFNFNIFNIIHNIDNNITYGMLFFTGLLTSIHCISMCGAINLIVTTNKENTPYFKRAFFYNLGRVLSYSLIGGIVGLLGKVISINETINGLIIIMAALLMLLMSLNTLNVIKIKIPRFVNLKLKKPTNNSFVIGLLNGFMPCGPLQAMQLYALSTASFFKGFLSMFLFSLGTVPLMLFVSVAFNIFKGHIKIILNKIAIVLIFILSLIMFERGLSTMGINLVSSSSNYGNYQATTIYKDYQEVHINLSYNNYSDIIVQKGLKVKLIIDVDKKYLTGCNDTVQINEYNIKKRLVEGENIIEFTPDEVGDYSMNCWMNMIKNTIKLIDDKSYFESK